MVSITPRVEENEKKREEKAKAAEEAKKREEKAKAAEEKKRTEQKRKERTVAQPSELEATERHRTTRDAASVAARTAAKKESRDMPHAAVLGEKSSTTL